MSIRTMISVIAVVGLLVVLKMLGVGSSMIRISDPVSNKIVIILAVVVALVFGINQLKKKDNSGDLA